MKINSLLVGESLELLLEKNQSVPQEQRAFMKIMIRCFAGEVEAWISLLEQLNFFNIFPLQADVVKSLFMQILLGFKGSMIRSSAFTANKLKSLTILEILSNGSFKTEFFKILEKTVPKGMDNGGFSKFKDILILVVERRYEKVMEQIDDLMDFVNLRGTDMSPLLQLILVFAAFNQLTEAQLSRFLSEVYGVSSYLLDDLQEYEDR